MNVLLIDDDVDLAESLTRYFSLNEIQSNTVTTAGKAVSTLRECEFDAVLLDVMLPDQSGFEFLPKLRTLTRAPVFMLTALGEEEHRVTGLNLGADDYITKPFSAKELVARLRAMQRRQGHDRVYEEELTHDDLAVFPNQLRVVLNGTPVDLTGVECQILIELIRAPDKTASREWLSRNALGRDASPLDRSLDVHISNLRRKLGRHPTKGNRIRSLRGRGYLLTR